MLACVIDECWPSELAINIYSVNFSFKKEVYMYIIVLMLIILILFIGYKLHDRYLYFLWKQKIKDKHDYDEDSLRRMLNQIAHNAFIFSGPELPYGRAKWFLESEKAFKGTFNPDFVEFFGFSPIRNLVEIDFREFGMLLTQDGIYFSEQYISERHLNKKNQKYAVEALFIPFSGLWNVKYNPTAKKIQFLYKDFSTKTIFPKSELVDKSFLIEDLNNLINTGYTNDLTTGYSNDKNISKIDDAFNKLNQELLLANSIKTGSLGGINTIAKSHYHNETLNGIANSPQGHGFAAEYANNISDKIRNPFKNVTRVGQDNLKNGADRVVGNIKIQTKYCSSGRNSVNAAFDKKELGGMYRYKGMQLEVPKDQYNDATAVMKQKIRDGKVAGHSNPNDAYSIIRKGHVTWKEAHLIAKGGNVVSLKYDALDGVIQTLPYASIGFVITFAQAKWSGASNEEAAKLAGKQGIKTLLVGTATFAGSQQISKIYSSYMLKRNGSKAIGDAAKKKIVAENIAKNATRVISFAIIIGPDIFNTLTGRISKEQLLKNSVVAGSGFASGAVGGALGSVVPVVGTAIGSIIGGIVKTVASKKILDKFIEDDHVEMFAELKEEYIDLVMSINLSEEEFNKIQELIFDKKLESKLKTMFQQKDSIGSRNYARQEIVENSILHVIKEREIITNNDILVGLDEVQVKFQ